MFTTCSATDRMSPTNGRTKKSFAAGGGCIPSVANRTGRRVRDSASCIPDHLAPILERLGIVADQWEATIQGLDGWFPRAIGRASALSEAAAAVGSRWFRGVSRCRVAFVE